MARAEGTEPAWHKSSACLPGECVEVAASQGRVLIRDSANATGLVLMFTVDEWRRFACGIYRGSTSAPKSHEAESLCPA